MAFQLEQFVIDKKIAQIVTTPTSSRIYFPMENYGNSSRKTSSLFVTIDYTHTVDLELTFKVTLRDFPNTKEFSILSQTDPVAPYKVRFTASGKVVVPLPIPLRTNSLFIEPSVAVFGTCVIGFASDEGLIAPRF